jgi:hypothetical protein
MSEWYLRSVASGIMTVNVNAPGNGSSYASINSLMSGAQQTELANLCVIGVQITPVSAINYKSSTPSTANGQGQATAVAPTLDTNANPMPITAAQKPNETINIPWADWNIFLQSQTASAVVVSIMLFWVNKTELH